MWRENDMQRCKDLPCALLLQIEYKPKRYVVTSHFNVTYLWTFGSVFFLKYKCNYGDRVM